MPEKTRIAIVGWGNVGRGVYAALQKNPDMVFAGIITRDVKRVSSDIDRRRYFIRSSRVLNCSCGDEFLRDAAKRYKVVAILCGGSAKDLPVQGPHYARRVSTVDGFDTHADIPKYLEEMDKAARKFGNTSIISAGWDPGTSSLERVLGNAFLPGSKGYTFWGPGVSQGHSNAVREISGVVDARQYTLPVEDAVKRVRAGWKPELSTRQKHTRLVYVVAEKGADKAKIKRTIKTMPKYFADYDTNVVFISKGKMEREHSTYPHAGLVLTSGETGDGNKALIEYSNEWASNPEATASILVACARACSRLNTRGRIGAYTMLNLSPADLSPLSREELLERYM